MDLQDAMTKAELKLVCQGTSQHVTRLRKNLTDIKLFWENSCEGSINVDFDEAFGNCEQISLRSACLPEERPEREIGLQASKLAKAFFQLGVVFKKTTSVY